MTDQLHQDSLSELKREIDAIMCEGCKLGWPIVEHGMHRRPGFAESTFCESKASELLPLFDSIAAKAFDMAAQWFDKLGCTCPPNRHTISCATHLAFCMRQLAPASARRQLQLDLLRARLEAVNYVIAHAPGRLPQLVQDYIARLESEIAALEAQ